MRQNRSGDVLVVRRKIAFGDALVGIEQAVGMGQLYSSHPSGAVVRRARGLNRHGYFSSDLLGGLSSRSPLKEGWRSSLSEVHAAKTTSQTSLGSTQ